MGYIAADDILKAREMDLMTYLRNYEPQELVRVSGNTYCTREHESLRISNGKWYWFSHDVGGRSVSAETKKAVNKGKEAYRKHREEKRIEKNEERVNRYEECLRREEQARSEINSSQETHSHQTTAQNIEVSFPVSL